MPNYTYISNIPAAGNNPSNDQPNMQTNTNSISSIVNVDLYGFNNNNGGTHQQVTFPTASPGPYTPTGDAGVLFTQDDASSHAQLYFQNAVTTFQLTRIVSATGNANSSGSTGYTYLLGGILLQWGTITANTAGATITYPKAFSTIFSITTSVHAFPAIAASVANVTTTTASAISASGTPIMNWMAIGI